MMAHLGPFDKLLHDFRAMPCSAISYEKPAHFLRVCRALALVHRKRRKGQHAHAYSFVFALIYGKHSIYCVK